MSNEHYNPRPSDKFCLMSREFYEEVKKELYRIKTAVNIEKSTEITDALIKKLEMKFENKRVLDKLSSSDRSMFGDPRNTGSFVNPDNFQ